MLKTRIICLSAIGLLATACGGGGGLNPNKAAALFNNPDGNLTDDNATIAANEAIQSTLVDGQTGGLNPFAPTGLTQDQTGSQCISVSGQSASIDLACFAPDIECTGSGSISFTSSGQPNGNNFSVNFRYNNASLTCQGGGSFTCNGSGSYASVDGTIITCQDLNCTVEGITSSIDACTSFDATTGNNLVLVETEDGAVVCVRVVTNQDCSQACTEWRDAQGDSRIICDVDQAATDCAQTGQGVEDVSNCTIDRTNTSCDQF